MRWRVQACVVFSLFLSMAGMLAISGMLKSFPRSSTSTSTAASTTLRFFSSTFGFPKQCSSAFSTLNSPTHTMEHAKYDLVSDEFIDEYGVRQVLYQHKKSGANVLSVVAPKDDNKVFGITFKTPPEDSTGIPHILEHSVLCGSKHYPSKEPFAELLKGSLNTFLNAFTYPDRTCYPVASQNLNDFYNLVNVYLDAVLNPKAIHDPLILKQEGWHYELESVEEEMTYKGVVYNEMKGVYSSMDSILRRETQKSLFIENTYHVDSGGAPQEIPKLTFDMFKDFYFRYYHPSNSRVFFYGDDDPTKRLDLLDTYLSAFDKIQVDSSIPYQPKVDLVGTTATRTFPIAPNTPKKYAVTVNWLLNDEKMSSEEELELEILDHMLLGTPSSILRKRLIDAGYGESIAGGGLSSELLQSTFSLGLKGVDEENMDKVESLILETLEEIKDTGFTQDAIDASVNSIEFHLREFNTGSFPRGLSLMLGVLNKWIYEGSPSEGIRFQDALASIKQKDSKVYQDLVAKYFVENKHRVRMDMVPDENMEEEQVEREKEELRMVKERMTEDQLKEIIRETQELKQKQEAEDPPEVLAMIPRISLSDISRVEAEIPLEVEEVDGIKVLTHELPTNGILYSDMGFDMTDISTSDLALLPVLRRLLIESGTEQMDETTLTRLIGTKTGGISAIYLNQKPFSPKISDSDEVISLLMLRGKAVADNIDSLFTILVDILNNVKLDNQKKVLDVLKEQKIGMENSIISSGHSYAASRIGSSFSILGYIGEQTSGISYYQGLAGMIEQAEHDWPTFLNRLVSLKNKLVRRNGLVVNLTGDSATLAASRGPLKAFIAEMAHREVPDAETTSFFRNFNKSQLAQRGNEGLVVPTQVNYVGRGGQIYFPGEEVSGASSVVAGYLSSGYLWDNVRVMGGAYGGFCSFGSSSGRIMFLSYRDPNVAATLDIYDRSADFLEKVEISQDDIEKAIIGAIGRHDTPLFPDQKGYRSFQEYLTGESREDRQQYRDEILGTSEKDFREFASRLSGFNGTVAIIGSKAALEKGNKELGGMPWTLRTFLIQLCKASCEPYSTSLDVSCF